MLKRKLIPNKIRIDRTSETTKKRNQCWKLNRKTVTEQKQTIALFCLAIWVGQ